MKFSLQLSVQSDGSTTSQKAKAAIIKQLKGLPNLKIKLTTKPDIVTPAKHQLNQQVADYSSKIERLSQEVELIANDFGVDHAYGSEISSVKRQQTLLKSISPKLKKVTTNSSSLDRIKRFLIELPDTPEFDKLRFMQELIQRRLADIQLVGNSEQIESIVLHDFEKYRLEYEQIYLARLIKRKQAIQAWQKNLPELTHKVEIITALDQIKTLGLARGTRLATELKKLIKKYPIPNQTHSEIRQVLALEPTIAGISLFEIDPTREFEILANKISATLKTKLIIVCEESVNKILATSREPSVQKLTKLLNLSQIEKITHLFTKRTTPKIIHELQKLLGEKNLTTIALGDFMPQTKTIKSASEAKKLSTELERFIINRLSNQPKQGILVLT